MAKKEAVWTKVIGDRVLYPPILFCLLRDTHCSNYIITLRRQLGQKMPIQLSKLKTHVFK